MFRKFAGVSLATFVVGASALVAASFMTAGSAEAFGGRYERGYERPAYGWRPPPPAMHGYWGHRRWQRYNEGFRPPPRHHYGYGRDYGWR
ncbi:hypothetical protein ASE63_00945 [Bosea sp. Root381]|uniref:hypothetical protein n=1 Tax=Bosea sp. Root381 TaxID=1736524 RepID=UPI0006F697D9|nr:hypothetical protein [Bosea sp. Root381]KRE17800.1 hypothetical protein ASE63_00945 [Bosea sp. Root381]